MFFKFHTRRGVSKGTKENRSARSSSKGGIFRQKKTVKTVATIELFPTIEAGLTFSLSEDYDDAPVLCEVDDDDDDVVQEEEPTITFTEKEVMQNELNHIRKMRGKEAEVDKMKTVMDELKAAHVKKMAKREEELARTKEVFAKVLNKKEEELTEVRTELEGIKIELTKVCSVLIGCQHDLHQEQMKNLLSWFRQKRWRD